MPTAQDANQQFDQLWEEIGKKRLILGDDDGKNIEIRLDIDLSPISLLKRLHGLSEEGESSGALGSKARKALHEAIDDWENALSDMVPGTLRDRWNRLLKRGR